MLEMIIGFTILFVIIYIIMALIADHELKKQFMRDIDEDDQ